MIRVIYRGNEDGEEEEIEEGDEHAQLKGNYDNDEWKELSLAERAAAAGDYQRVKVLLKEGLGKDEIQKAFAAAAYNDKKEVAWLLVEAGAGFYYFNRDYDEDFNEYCPVCLTRIIINDGTVCPHFVCVIVGKDYYWPADPDFEDEVYELTERLRKRNLTDEDFERITGEALEDLRILFKQVRKHHEFYWTVKGQVLVIEYTDQSIFSNYFLNYFHPDAEFARKVKDEAQVGLAWLEKGFPEFWAGEVGKPVYSSNDNEDTWEGDREAEGRKAKRWVY